MTNREVERQNKLENALKIFMPYDIRALYPDNFTNEVAFIVGQSLGDMDLKKVVIGYDVRESSPTILKALYSGLVNQANPVDIINIGQGPGSLTYFKAWKEKAHGFYITASHNPPEYNGIKFCRPNGVSYLEELKVIKEKFISRYKKGTDQAKTALPPPVNDVLPEYLNYLNHKISIDKSLKIVTDCFHAAASLIIRDVFSAFDLDGVFIASDPDGKFHGEKPEPKGKNLQRLQDRVRKEKAIFGVAFDGDADRSVFIDGRGRIVDGSIMTSIFARQALEKHPGATILVPVNSTSLLEKEVVEKMGGKLIWTRIGHNFIEAELVEKNCILAGEPSSHYYFADCYPFSDGILSTLKLAEFLSSSDTTLVKLFDEFPKTAIIRESMDYSNHEKKWEAFNEIKRRVQELDKPVTFVDGVKINESSTEWLLLRCSNTEPIIRVTIEAATNTRAIELYKEYKETLKL